MNWLKVVSYVPLALLVAPVLFLVYEGLGPLRTASGYSPAIFQSIELSLLTSALAAVLCVVLFTPLAYYFSRNKNKVAETFSDLPASIPHPIIGIALLLLVSPVTPLGKILLSIGFNLFDTVLGIVVALTIVSAPIYVKSMQPYFESMDISHENYALGLGASRFRTFVSVVVPNSGRGVLSASLISMSRALSEFGSLAILAYYVLGGYFNGVSPISVAIWQGYSYLGLPFAVTASAVMILVSLALMVALRFVERKI